MSTSEPAPRVRATAEGPAQDERRHPAAGADELADVLLYLVRLADVLGVDLDEACRSKLAANAAKYPVERARGRGYKYDAI